MSYGRRLLRARVLEALENRVKQFRSREELLPFRVPHEPLDIRALIEEALLDYPGTIAARDLRSKTVIRFEWDDGSSWDAWVITLPSGIFVYCDSSHDETRVLASVKRGSPDEADRFFLELLAESSVEHFGIEMTGGAPDHVRTAITDREFLTDIFVELFEGTPAERSIHPPSQGFGETGAATTIDFRADVERWLDRVLIAPTPSKARRSRKRVKRLRDEDPH
jgi:hypothetical protein